VVVIPLVIMKFAVIMKFEGPDACAGTVPGRGPAHPLGTA
jgi:hypothetical protein